MISSRLTQSHDEKDNQAMDRIVTDVYPPAWLSSSFLRLANIHDPAWIKCVTAASLHSYGSAQTVFQEGEDCQQLTLVISGLLRMQRFSNDGHEITLYHLSPGEICHLTAIRLLNKGPHQSDAITESDSQIARLPGHLFRLAVRSSSSLSRYVFAAIDKGQENLLTLIEDVAFGDMNKRLVGHLLAHQDNTLFMTHQELAAELGTAREVVSRLLKNLERRSCVSLHRGNIEIIDRQALEDCLTSQSACHQ